MDVEVLTPYEVMSRWDLHTQRSEKLARIGLGIIMLSSPILPALAYAEVETAQRHEAQVMNAALPCVEPTASDRKEVLDIVNAPIDPIVQTVNQASLVTPENPEDQWLNFVISDDLKQAYVAEKYGLTVHRLEPLFREFNDSNFERPFTDYYRLTKQFLKQYGVSLQMGKSDGEYSIGETQPTPAYFENQAAKHKLYGIAESFSRLPVEFIRYINLNRVILLDLSKQPTAAAYVVPEKKHGIYLDLNRIYSLAFEHEMAHLMDAAACGNFGAGRDYEFEQLNPRNIYQSPTPYKSYQTLKKARKLVRHAHRKLDPTTAQQKQLAKLESMVVTESDYGFTNPNEDKAEVGKHIVYDGGQFEITSSAKNVLRAKYSLLAARLYDEHPEILKYLVESHRY